MSAEPTRATRPAARPQRTPPRRSPDVVRPQSVMSLSEGPLRTANWIDFGHPGCGKSCLFGTAAKGMFLDCDNGGSDAPAALGSKCDVGYITNYKELTEAFEFFRYEEGCKVYDWVFWDSVTLFMDRSLYDDLLLEAHDRNPKTQSRDVASQREYLVQQNRIASFFRDFSELPINFGVAAHVMAVDAPEIDDEEAGLVYMPLIPGGKHGEFSQKICGYANLVTYHAMLKSGRQRLLTKRTKTHFAKDRFNALKDEDGKWRLDNPTVPKIEALIKESRATREDQDQHRSGSRQGRTGTGRVRRPAAGAVRRRSAGN